MRRTVEFEFEYGDKVKTVLGVVGWVTMGGIDNGEFPVYHVVDAENNARWFAAKLLTLVPEEE